MRDIIIMISSTIGVLFIFSTSLAMLRKPDVYLRISVTSKASTLGVGLILLATAIFFNEYSVTTRVIAVILFVFLTVPIGSHMLARAAYFTKTPIWGGTKIDDLAGQYDPETHELHSENRNSSIKPEKTDKAS
ncbi:monovalent cation/H(+) antiporter subunit G [Aquiflexum lacus]|uniref:monovalent cation/H(+) antiporter subunit G n=1 Tax=Aquiflexum lacus TaxID=2483805 RepID=UPI001894FA22|nr:monovalent cation/H(+) antiporter subunit G [Aquiflexum lacus]